MKYLRNSRHTISPQKHCHQSPKHLRDKYALTLGMVARHSSIWSAADGNLKSIWARAMTSEAVLDIGDDDMTVVSLGS